MSAFWLQKMRTYFNRIDFDGDGVITQKDFEGMADRFEKSGKLDTPTAAKLRACLLQLWGKYRSQVANSDTITQEAFINSIQNQLSCNELKKSVEAPLPLFFQAVDANNDCYIQTDEYAEFFAILGLDPELAHESFKAIDTNNDKLLSLDEFVQAGSDFFTSEDPKAPTRLFWGPLID